MRKANTKKLLSALVALVMVLGLLPMAAAAGGTGEDTSDGFAIPDGTVDWEDAPGKTVGDLYTAEDDITIAKDTTAGNDHTYKLTGGKAKWQEWDNFSSNTTLQKGYYMAIFIPKKMGSDTIKGMKVRKTTGADAEQRWDEYTPTANPTAFKDTKSQTYTSSNQQDPSDEEAGCVLFAFLDTDRVGDGKKYPIQLAYTQNEEGQPVYEYYYFDYSALIPAAPKLTYAEAANLNSTGTGSAPSAPGYGWADNYSAALNAETKTITVSARNLKKHVNQPKGNDGQATGGAIENYWIGAAVTLVENATYKWKLDVDETYGTITTENARKQGRTQTRTDSESEQLVTLYWNNNGKDKWSDYKTGEVIVIVENVAPVTYTVQFDVKTEGESIAASQEAVDSAFGTEGGGQITGNVEITVTGSKDVGSAEVPLSKENLGKLSDASADATLTIDTPVGGVSVNAKNLGGKLGSDEALTFVMENTTAADATSGKDPETFDVGFYKANGQEAEVTGMQAFGLSFQTGFASDTNVVVRCLDDDGSDKTGDGNWFETQVGEGGVVTVQTTHLSKWRVSAQPTATLKYWDSDQIKNTGDAKYYYGKLEISELTEGNWYLVVLTSGNVVSGNKVANICTLQQLTSGTTLTIPCQSGLNLKLYDVTKDGGFEIPSDFTSERTLFGGDGVPVDSCKQP